jgi:hypothetical protein
VDVRQTGTHTPDLQSKPLVHSADDAHAVVHTDPLPLPFVKSRSHASDSQGPLSDTYGAHVGWLFGPPLEPVGELAPP